MPVPFVNPHRNVDRAESLHIPIQMNRPKRFWTQWSTKELPVVVQKQTGPLPVSRPEKRGCVVDMAGRFLLIDEDDIDPAVFQAVADVGEPVQHLESPLARPAHTDDNQSVTAHQVSQEPVRVVMGQKRNTGVNHVNLPSNAAPPFRTIPEFRFGNTKGAGQ